MENKLCACGCGIVIPFKEFHRWNDVKYIKGHHQKRKNNFKVVELRKGKSYEEIYGSKERANLEKKKRGESISKEHKKAFESGERVIYSKGLTKENCAGVLKSSIARSGKERTDIRGKNNPMKNMLFKEKSHTAIINFWKSEESKKLLEKQREVYWSNPIWIEKHKEILSKTLKRRPTSYEKKISELCIENNLPFIYTGDGTFLIGYKNPDFVNEKDKIAIEVYEPYFKIRMFKSCENYEKQRREYFSKYGYRTIFIKINQKDKWEISKINVLNKIKEVLK